MEGAKVYVQVSENWQKGTVVAALGSGRYKVQLEPWEGSDEKGGEVLEVDASKMEGGMLPFQNADMPEIGFPNMTTLDHLHEAALLHNLRVRFFSSGCPYTYTADIVIAVNPYRWYPELYTEEMRKEYLVFDKAKLAPHAYAASSAAFLGLQESKADQSILVSGESGAGKTETVKILMAHLALIASSNDPSHIKRIVESNPLLESFGNAQTVRNDNSSRFGKFLELQLDGKFKLTGSKCRTYLLEKSRVVGQDAGERNYHIFYQMLAVSEEQKSSFHLGGSEYTRDTMRYTRMGKSKTDKIEGLTDAERFKVTTDALALVGVEGEVLAQMLSGLAGILLLGQVDLEGGDEAKIASSSAEVADAAGKALQVEDYATLEHALTKSTITVRNESIVKALTPEGAANTRDALSKELYSRIFDWLVGRICRATTAAASDAKYFVGMLDIFGFESFAINRFEQLCINYANEKLQQKFTLDVFKAVQQEYSEEGIPWDRIEFKDNAPVLALIESKMGIIAMLNEECVRPKGSDENFVSKLTTVHKADPAFAVPRIGAQKEVQFSIKHYAGVVMYTATGWLERNKDTLSEDVILLLRRSRNPLIASLFPVPLSDETTAPGKGASNTVASKFKTSLVQLMETIGQTSTQYVRCIKPNKNKSPREVDNNMVVEQLRCAGVIEAIRISRAGFPARMPLGDFANRFGIMTRVAGGGGKGSVPSSASAKQAVAALKGTDKVAACKALVSFLLPDSKEQYEVGRTRVYFKIGVLEALEERRAMLFQVAATEITRRVRGLLTQARYQRMRYAALRGQSLFRMRRERKVYLRTRYLIIRVQSLRRAVLARRRFAALKRIKCATTIQAGWRRTKAKMFFSRAKRAVVQLQAASRRFACRRRYLEDLAEFKQQAKLENQVKALQAKLEAAQAAAEASAKAAAEEAAARAAMAATAAAAPNAEAAAPAAAPPQVVEVFVPAPAVAPDPPVELLETLNSLTAENAKLRAENDKQRHEIERLRKENQQLRSGQAQRGDWLASIRRSKKKDAGHPPHAQEGEAGDQGVASAPLATPRDEASASTRTAFPEAHQSPASPEDDPRSSTLLSAFSANGHEGLQLFEPLTEYWNDVPCPVLPLLKIGTEVHIKCGANIVYVDDRTMQLMWRPWMNLNHGYRTAMSFMMESRISELRPEGDTGSANADGRGDHSIGSTFVLRSSLTGKYVDRAGMLKNFMYAKANKPDEALTFTFIPLENTDLSPGMSSTKKGLRRLGTAQGYAVALKVAGEKAFFSFSKDGSVSTTQVENVDNDLRFEKMAMTLEQLLPRATYEIEVEEKEIGILTSKDLPLRVLGFNAVAVQGQSGKGPGFAERTGRVHIGDVISTLNGEDVSGLSVQELLQRLTGARPITVGFTVPKDAGAPVRCETRRIDSKSFFGFKGKTQDSLVSAAAQLRTKGLSSDKANAV
eukprot:CAMPEP_0178393170 /NCGR_PEP_ID=MMETSP0689_2-20121128/12050_1 /TAXON_ID=160604 /ORGANISM="Amphidinium massartii, Strain CS-259" /LENGTH=1441 /DNA_ID=CAMNT_0020013755 /DNA_START=60 /DNA_END=4385 /DNA_ORIENTATION=-